MAFGAPGGVSLRSAALALAPYVFAVLGLGTCLTAGGASAFASGSAGSVAADRTYDQRIARILRRYDASIAAFNQVLAERDANPGLVGSADWLRRDARAAQDLQSAYADARAIQPPADAAAAHACIVDALRLTSTGATMLREAFLTDGHGAYYLASHGNWDLNLGARELQKCRAMGDT